ncbi:hypothetical protein UR09_01975 [Candidatus Nitromaritima sp. SCGC AAA799-A02]|nr:hypothetical protein UZ36_03570 [Candidatus Nitromaritima sp. SCGC AAA799-C22]KMP12073.1 hypothetical protein UR09_01975 [Candidatus Nitromaritima sp. SCGC AAA799-A02]
MPTAKILVVEDEEGMRFFLSEALAKEGYRYKTASEGQQAIKRLKKEPFDLVILDYNLPHMDGLETFRKMKQVDPDISVIMITAYGSKDLAYQAMNEGVFDFFNKPLDVGEMRVVIHRALERVQLKKEVRNLRSNLQEKFGVDRILGSSSGIRQVIERVRRVAESDVSVLILGESGTGKEIVAQAVHAHSSRRNGPFIKVNCAAVPQDLLEAEFFGYEKGAFTGAVKNRRGKFEQADGGTLFLDEIGDMALSTQIKILRAIQENEFERVGGEESIKTDIRLVTATNKDLERAVSEGEFREDLYYRLNVVSLPLPPLRERREDIPMLAEHFLKLYNKKFEKNIESISAEAMDLLLNYSWPGNIRELENVIQRGIVLACKNILERQDLMDVYPPLAEPGTADMLGSSGRLQDKVEAVVCAAEKRLILEALREENWKRQETADRLGISRKSLHNKMKKYGIGD